MKAIPISYIVFRWLRIERVQRASTQSEFWMVTSDLPCTVVGPQVVFTCKLNLLYSAHKKELGKIVNCGMLVSIQQTS